MNFNSSRLISYFIAALLFFASITPMTAQTDPLGIGGITPNGYWEAADHESRYRVNLCGSGVELCGELIWIRPDLINSRNSQYLHTKIADEVARTRPVEWKGQVSIYGNSYAGKVVMLAENKVLVTLCAYVVLCERMELFRISDALGEASEKV